MDIRIYFFDILTILIAFAALIVSVFSLRKSHLNQKPHLALLRMYFEPNDFHIYSKEKLSGNKKLKRRHEQLIENTLNTGSRFSLQFIDNERYILVNSLPNNYRIEDVRLILAPYQVEYKNTGYFATEIKFKEAIVRGIDKKKLILRV